jgi:hypothetical protein
MRSARCLLFVASALFAISARSQIIEPTTENERVLVEAVKKRLSPCFTLLGVNGSLPVAAKPPPTTELLASVLLRASGPLVSDGYSYMLLIHGPSNSAFVEQFGGFAGSRTVFGPVPLETTCP